MCIFVNIVASRLQVTEVEFADLSTALVAAYVATGEPMSVRCLLFVLAISVICRDKAGGYGIQGHAGPFVRRINGCYFNVVGFPAHTFCSKLLELVNDKI